MAEHIVISRELVDDELSWAKPEIVLFFLHLVFLASKEDEIVNGTELKRGQIVTSRRELSRKTGLSEQIIRAYLKLLSLTHRLTCKSTRNFTVITICDYDNYDIVSNPLNPQTPVKVTTDNEDIYEGETSLAKRDDMVNKDDAKEKENDKFVKDFKDFFNRTMSDADAIIPRVQAIGGQRKQYLLARLREFGKEKVEEVVRKAAGSDFLNGKNSRAWVAAFDWMFRPNNFPKVLDGNYDNRTGQNGNHTGQNAGDRRRGFEDIPTSVEEYYNSL